MTPYRDPSPPGDPDREAREVREFARQMHAGRRRWASRSLGEAILLTMIGLAQLLLAVVFLIKGSGDTWTLMFPGALGAGLLALAIRSVVGWRREVRQVAKPSDDAISTEHRRLRIEVGDDEIDAREEEEVPRPSAMRHLETGD